MKTTKIKNLFINFFEEHGHKKIKSSSLIPSKQDKSLLFTNSGMTQFKDIFLGLKNPEHSKVITIQKCLRAGGKHNDLQNVGYTKIHHTFFEMLGNFSFGDYFKKEALTLAWEFLTEVVKLPEEKLWITVLNDDKETENIWLNEIKISPKRLRKLDKKHNFWSMAKVGPCGPCSEIFYDLNSQYNNEHHGKAGEQLIEIWNIVFMQYNCNNDNSLVKLSKPFIDAGMGLERLASILQSTYDNYKTDIFRSIIKQTAKILSTQDLESKSLRIIADHIRASVFLIYEGIQPSNEGRGYVLRRIIRRAIRHGNKLNKSAIFLHKVARFFITDMHSSYPELSENKETIINTLFKEEEQFKQTLVQGTKYIHGIIKNLDKKIISGKLAFQLYDTYGFPIDLTIETANENNLKVDIDAFNKKMIEQKERSKNTQSFNSSYNVILSSDKSHFVGYYKLKSNSVIKVILQDKKEVNSLKKDQYGLLIIDSTPFYAEAGGQSGDNGIIFKSDNSTFYVSDTQKIGNNIAHYGIVKNGTFKVNEEVTAEIDKSNRNNLSINHTATHLLHSALRKELGQEILQKGSCVKHTGLRFDFSCSQKITREAINKIENTINGIIRQNLKTEIIETTQDIANDMGAIALFEEKYDDLVRVVKIDNFSSELCGGTHVKNTCEIGLFKIINHSNIAAGIKRIEAVTAEYAELHIQSNEKKIKKICNLIKTDEKSIVDNIEKLRDQLNEKDKTILSLQEQLIAEDTGKINEETFDKFNFISGSFSNIKKNCGNNKKQK